MNNVTIFVNIFTHLFLLFLCSPGSQNGWDHSGCGYDSPDGRGWNTDAHRNLSLRGIEVLASRYGHRENLIGIELLNEPAADLERRYHKELLEYYQAGYHIVRKYSKKALVIFSVLWEDYYNAWSGDMLEPEYYNVAMDWHSYGFDNMDDAQQAVAVLHMQSLIEKHSQFHPIIIGEWSDFYHRRDAPIEPDRKFLDRQVSAYESALGWYFWNFKVVEKGFDGWSMETLIAKGYDFHLKPSPHVIN